MFFDIGGCNVNEKLVLIEMKELMFLYIIFKSDLFFDYFFFLSIDISEKEDDLLYDILEFVSYDVEYFFDVVEDIGDYFI